MSKYYEEILPNLKSIERQIEQVEKKIASGINKKERHQILSQLQQASGYLNKVDMLSNLENKNKLTEDEHKIIIEYLERLLKCFDKC